MPPPLAGLCGVCFGSAEKERLAFENDRAGFSFSAGTSPLVFPRPRFGFVGFARSFLPGAKRRAASTSTAITRGACARSTAAETTDGWFWRQQIGEPSDFFLSRGRRKLGRSARFSRSPGVSRSIAVTTALFLGPTGTSGSRPPLRLLAPEPQTREESDRETHARALVNAKVEPPRGGTRVRPRASKRASRLCVSFRYVRPERCRCRIRRSARPPRRALTCVLRGDRPGGTSPARWSQMRRIPHHRYARDPL